MRWQGKLVIFLGFSGVSFAQVSNPDELIPAALANYENRDVQAKEYEYREHDTITQGNFGAKEVATYEILIIDGQQLRRELHEGKAMALEQEVKEHRDRIREAQKRADQAVGGPQTSSVTVSRGAMPRLSLQHLLEFFDIRFVKAEIIEGRSTYVLDAKPKAGQKPSDEVESDLRSFKISRKIRDESFTILS